MKGCHFWSQLIDSLLKSALFQQHRETPAAVSIVRILKKKKKKEQHTSVNMQMIASTSAYTVYAKTK